MSNNTIIPRRPFGVTIAILLCLLFFAVIPSLAILSRILIEQHISANNTFTLPDGSEATILNSGVESLGSSINQTTILQQGIISILVFILAFFAWRGKPSWVRFGFMGFVLIISAILIYQNLLISQLSNLEGGTGQGLFDFLKSGNTLFLFILPVYVIWYLNRAPARAFYRGYYLQEEINQIKQQSIAN